MKKWFASLIIMASVCGLVFTVISPQVVYAAKECDRSFLGFPTWYRDLTDDQCNIKAPASNGLSTFIWHIVLNIIEIVLMAVGYIALFFIMYGGFTCLTSVGEPADIVKARKTILNAIIGLIISFAAVSLISFVSGILK
jgi:hypothetical protein